MDFFISAQVWMERILDHPFLQEMGKGILCIERFAQYMEQDALYLLDFAKVLIQLSKQAESLSTRETLLQLSQMTFSGEQRIHREFFIPEQRVPSMEKKTICRSYTEFLLLSVSHETFPSVIAALLPCFWTYREVGRHFCGKVREDNRYKRWLDLYNSVSFARDVETMLELCHKVWKKASKKERQGMKEAFEQSIRFEYAFWGEAYRVQ